MPPEATTYYLAELVMPFDTAMTIVSHSSKQVMTTDTSMTMTIGSELLVTLDFGY